MFFFSLADWEEVQQDSKLRCKQETSQWIRTASSNSQHNTINLNLFTYKTVCISSGVHYSAFYFPGNPNYVYAHLKIFVIRNCLVISMLRWEYMIQVCLAYPTSNKRIYEHQMFLFSNECLFRNFRELTHCHRHPAEISLTLTKQFPVIVQGSVYFIHSGCNFI